MCINLHNADPGICRFQSFFTTVNFITQSLMTRHCSCNCNATYIQAGMCCKIFLADAEQFFYQCPFHSNSIVLSSQALVKGYLSLIDKIPGMKGLTRGLATSDSYRSNVLHIHGMYLQTH